MPISQALTAESVVRDGETYSNFHPVEKPTSSYIDYVYRGPGVSRICLYEYRSQIGSVPRQGHGEDEQDGLWIPAIWSALTEVNNKGKTPGQILDDSQNVKNDIVEAMLGLFVPWECLQGLFENKVRPELPSYLQRLAENSTYLRRSKEDADKDRKARQIEIADWEGRTTESGRK
ncbi:hypothetical protein V8E54_006508 [Elaphomyces granulatus]